MLRQKQANGAIFHSPTKEWNMRNAPTRIQLNHGAIQMANTDGVSVQVTTNTCIMVLNISYCNTSKQCCTGDWKTAFSCRISGWNNLGNFRELWLVDPVSINDSARVLIWDIQVFQSNTNDKNKHFFKNTHIWNESYMQTFKLNLGLQI